MGVQPEFTGGSQNYFDNRLVTRYGADPTGARNSWQAFYNSIQGATGNGFVIVPPGTYKIEGAPLVVPANVQLVGLNQKVTLTRSSIVTNLDPFFSIQGSNVIVEGFKFTITGALERAYGIGITAGVSRVTVRDCDFENVERGIDVFGTSGSTCDNITIERCNFTHPAVSARNNRAISLTFARYAVVDNCFVDGGTLTDYQMGVSLVSTTECAITNTSALRCSSSGINSDNFLIGLKVDACYIENCGASGMTVNGAGAGLQVRDIRIINSFCFSNAHDGLRILSSTGPDINGLVLTNNVFKGNTYAGARICVRNGSLVGNTYRQNGTEGLTLVTSSGSKCANITVTGPNIAGNSVTAVTVAPSLYADCLGLVINGGTIDGKDADTVTDPSDMSGVTQTGGSAIQIAVGSDNVQINNPLILNVGGALGDIDIDATSGSIVVHRTGTGSPEAAALGGIGSTFYRSDGGVGTTLYVKEAGNPNVNTGWASIGEAGTLIISAVATSDPAPVALGTLQQTDPSGGAFAVTLPAIAAANAGQAIIVKNTTSSTTAVTLTPTGADTIDAAATKVMTVGFASLTLVSDGVSNWIIT